MKVYVRVVAVDEANGVKATNEDFIEVPGNQLKLHEMMFGNNPEELVSAISDSVFAGAVRTIKAAANNPVDALTEARPGAKVGVSPTGKEDPLFEMLGGDLIDHMSGQERASRAHQPEAARPGPQRNVTPDGPGPIGFGNDRGR